MQTVQEIQFKGPNLFCFKESDLAKDFQHFQLHQIKLNFVEGFGFTGIAVALMGRNHPIGVLLASLLFGFLYQGGAELSFEYGVDRNIVVVLQGLVILFSGALEHMFRPSLERTYLKLFGSKNNEQQAEKGVA